MSETLLKVKTTITVEIEGREPVTAIAKELMYEEQADDSIEALKDLDNEEAQW